MREHPWNVRNPGTHHHQWFRNLRDLHAMTAACLAEMNLERPSHFLPRGSADLFPGTRDLIDAFEARELEDLLDDTRPEDLLARLEHTVLALQASALKQVLDRAPSEDQAAVRNQLERIAWRCGRACATERWAGLDAASRADLRGVFAAFRATPLAGAPGTRAFLVRRAVQQELELELRACPHDSPYLELREIADELCSLHAQWVRGFVYEINPKLAVEYHPRTESGAAGRCTHRWHYPAAGAASVSPARV